MLVSFLIGLSLSLLIALPAFYKHSLTLSGFIASLLFGSIIYIFGGIISWSLLILFFITSSVLTKIHIKIDDNNSAEMEADKKGRTYWQVICNAFAPALLSFIFYLTNNEVYLIGTIVAIATATADTWASEIGKLSSGKAFSILNFKLMTKGLSGAITILGTTASFLGAGFIALVFGVYYYIVINQDLVQAFVYFFIIAGFGFIGSLIDSYIGAAFQAKYKDPATGKIYERIKLPTKSFILVSGFSLITNDIVNLLATTLTSILAVLLLLD